MFFKVLRAVGRGVAGIVIWPVATVFSLRRMCKVVKDPDISFIHTTCDEEGLSSFCPDPFNRCLNDSRPDYLALQHMEHLAVARYKMSLSFINKQKLTLFVNTLQFTFATIVITGASFSDDPDSLNYSIKISGYMNCAMNGLYGFAFCLIDKEAFSSAIDAIVTPFKSLCYRNPRFLTQDIVLQSALLTNNTKIAYNLIQNNGRSRLNSEILDFSEKLQTIESALKESTQLSTDLTNIVLQYCVSPVYISFLDSNHASHKNGANKPILPSLSARLQHLDHQSEARLQERFKEMLEEKHEEKSCQDIKIEILSQRQRA